MFVLNPMLFNIFINNLDEGRDYNSSNVQEMWETANSTEDSIIIQNDTTELCFMPQNTIKEWQMAKYYTMERKM